MSEGVIFVFMKHLVGFVTAFLLVSILTCNAQGNSTTPSAYNNVTKWVKYMGEFAGDELHLFIDDLKCDEELYIDGKSTKKCGVYSTWEKDYTMVGLSETILSDDPYSKETFSLMKYELIKSHNPYIRNSTAVYRNCDKNIVVKVHYVGAAKAKISIEWFSPDVINQIPNLSSCK